MPTTAPGAATGGVAAQASTRLALCIGSAALAAQWLGLRCEAFMLPPCRTSALQQQQGAIRSSSTSNCRRQEQAMQSSGASSPPSRLGRKAGAAAVSLASASCRKALSPLRAALGDAEEDDENDEDEDEALAFDEQLFTGEGTTYDQEAVDKLFERMEIDMEMDEDGLIKPPDRAELLELMDSRAAADGDDGESTANMNDDFSVPMPPYEFQFPGEFGNPNVCTDPSWNYLMLTMQFLGFPFRVINTAGMEDVGPALVMGEEYYDNPEDVLLMVPRRFALSDFISSEKNIQKEVNKVMKSFLAIINNKVQDTEVEDKLMHALEDSLMRIDNRLSKFSEDDAMLSGDNAEMSDLWLTVILYHVTTALSHLFKWKMPKKCGVHIRRYMKDALSMDIWKEMAPPKDLIIKRYEAMRGEV